MGAMLSIQQALQHIIQRVEPLDHERVYLVDAISRTLAQPLYAQRQAPSWDNSAMDGYAVRASDVPAPNLSLPVSDTVAAGDPGDSDVSMAASALSSAICTETGCSFAATKNCWH